jgi:serine/threonine protein kinase
MPAGTKADAKQDGLRGTLPTGTRLRNYELISILGHGGFGITYYARDTTLGREVAIKEYLPTSLALREDGTMVVPRSTQLAEDFIWGRERFLEEARILATLEGAPAVVRVYDFLEANGTAYVVMGLARGDTLEQRLKRDKQLPPRRADVRTAARWT